MNNKQHQHSQQAITRMIDRLEERYGNTICNIHQIDFSKATQADYINGIDAIMIDCTGNSHKLQFKSRMTSTDICVELATLPALTDLSYYDSKHSRHFMIDTKSADIFVQEIADGTTFIYNALQLHTLAHYPELWNNPIHRNKEGQYLLFIPADHFTDMLVQINLYIATGWTL